MPVQSSRAERIEKSARADRRPATLGDQIADFLVMISARGAAPPPLPTAPPPPPPSAPLRAPTAGGSGDGSLWQSSPYQWVPVRRETAEEDASSFARTTVLYDPGRPGVGELDASLVEADPNTALEHLARQAAAAAGQPATAAADQAERGAPRPLHATTTRDAPIVAHGADAEAVASTEASWGGASEDDPDYDIKA